MAVTSGDDAHRGPSRDGDAAETVAPVRLKLAVLAPPCTLLVILAALAVKLAGKLSVGSCPSRCSGRRCPS